MIDVDKVHARPALTDAHVTRADGLGRQANGSQDTGVAGVIEGDSVKHDSHS